MSNRNKSTAQELEEIEQSIKIAEAGLRKLNERAAELRGKFQREGI